MGVSTERLKEIIEHRSPSLRWGEAEKIAAELLAARETKPSYWLSLHKYQSYLKFSEADAIKDVAEMGGIMVVPLFTAPPAAAVLLANTEEGINEKSND